jgi:DNA-binding transcriptional ArsR family regulator
VTIRISKGNLTFQVDTQAEFEQVLAWLDPMPVGPKVNGSITDTMSPPIGEGEFREAISNELAKLPTGTPLNGFNHQALVDDLVSVTPAHQMIPVRRILLDVYDIIKEFPEGITCKGVSELIGIKADTISHRMTRLKEAGLVEKVPHSIYWRATSLSRRAKLVKA